MRRHPVSLASAAIATLLLAAGPLSAQPFVFTHFAGTIGGPDAWDGQGAEARFSSPNAAAFDSEGNLYVADTRNRTVRKMTPTGVVTTLAGLAGVAGSRDGVGGAARFELPAGIGVDGAGRVYVADGASSAIRKIDLATGTVTTFAGRAGHPGSADGTGDAASFSFPTGLAVDTVGNVYVADTQAATIRKITPAGLVTTIAGSPGQRGDADGEGAEARFDVPKALTVDRAGNVYVVDERACTVRKITPQGAVSTLAGEPGVPGNVNGTGSAARFRSPGGIAADSTGNVYVADTGNGTVRRVTPAGVVTTLAGSGAFGSVDAVGKEASFARPLGIAADANDVLLVTEEGSALRRVTTDGVVTTVAGRPRVYGTSDASGADAQFIAPHAVATSRRGSVYVADAGAATIRRISPDGTVTTYAGLAGKPGFTDGPVSQAMFDEPSGVAVDADENVYVADRGNKSIRRISSTGFVTTLAGDTYAPAASVDGTGTDARFAYPVAVALDAAGNVWVAEESHAIRRVTPDGVVTTPAGSPSQPGSADGPGSAARFRSPRGLAADVDGNVWVADTGNATVRRIAPSGAVTTVAGVAQSQGTVDGVGPEARFALPAGITVDASGNAWVADAGSHTLRKIAGDRSVTTVGGAAGLAGAADGTGTDARFNGPTGVAAGADGRLFLADRGNATIRVGTPASLRDAATIDAAAALVGQRRQLDTDPRTASRWQWQIVRRPNGSSAALSSTSVRNPTFTPDLPDVYVFRLTAESGSAASITTVTLTVGTDAVPVESVSRLVPIVLDVASGTAHYVTDLALTNDTASRLDVALRYTASLGSKEGSGTAADSLAPGEQKRVADVLAWLRGKGLAIPSAAAQPQQGGTLLVTFQGPSAIDPKRVSATARTAALTSAPQPKGRAGLAYSGLLESEASTTSVTLYGLRSTAADRTNLAVFNTSDEPVTFNVTVCSGTGDARCVTVRGSETLAPRGWVQYGSAELLDANGIEKGWATIARASTTGSFSAYAVVNDNGTNDGSYVSPVADGGSATTLTVPVLVETPSFRSELILANATLQSATFVLDYVESISPAAGAGGSLLVTLRPREELIIPEAIDWLRTNRVAIGPKDGASYGGSLTVTVTPQAAAGAFAGARTASASPAGGQFGLFTPCLTPQQLAWSEAWVYGLRADAENRSNVAVIHAGTAADGPLVLQLQAFDGDGGGVARGEPLSVSLAPGQWAQPANFFWNSGVANGWVKVTRTSGSAPWLAYGVVNDGGSPGERTGDGAYVPMVK